MSVKNMQVKVDLEGWRTVKVLCVTLDRTLEDLMVEAMNDLMVKYGQKGTLERRSAERTPAGGRAMRDLL
ncbi:hypothetical protein FV242_32015 [Methylobacterium sp. WL64]|uniref:ribbon-helix-helix domain-containing protein n=1 Tax=Methylobacterium sp. WL64 TaxID=2603894 RepID=UPI0011CA2B30|nr:ribbon-helix-helix domain-containing protein [Methylobacterium sp. WL64]TXM97247.1 hypothetical protein FV242_32015 [Methylobacterium sp. WL64]